jgi:HPt (histidine-containing phosphotransfer) domain-containing protein
MTDAASGEASPLLILDPDVVDEMFNLPGRTGPSLLREILAIFLQAEPSRIAGLPRLAALRQGDEVARQSHQLAGSCAVLGARDLQAASLALENAALAGDWTVANEKLAAVNRAWLRLQQELANRKLLPA